MTKSVQYSIDNGASFSQFAAYDTADITCGTVVGNTFNCIKDSNDNCYTYCGVAAGSSTSQAKIIKSDSAGNKTVITVNYNYSGLELSKASRFKLSRDESTIFIISFRKDGMSVVLLSLPANSSGLVTPTVLISGIAASTGQPKLSIYKDLYIWITAAAKVTVYSYETNLEISNDTAPIQTMCYATCLDASNVLWVIGSDGTNPNLFKCVLEGATLVNYAVPFDTGIGILGTAIKEMKIDKWGDLIILGNYLTVSRLWKYTTAGVLVDTQDLSIVSFNLNTDYLGNYFYSTATNTYKIDANTATGQAFTGVGSSIRNTGMISNYNNITGYEPAVNAP